MLNRSKHVIHAVGPIYDDEEEDRCAEQLKGCYNTSLDLTVENKLTSIAFSGYAPSWFNDFRLISPSFSVSVLVYTAIPWTTPRISPCAQHATS